MHAEVFADTIYLDGPEYPEYVMHIFHWSILGPPNMRIY